MIHFHVCSRLKPAPLDTAYLGDGTPNPREKFPELLLSFRPWDVDRQANHGDTVIWCRRQKQCRVIHHTEARKQGTPLERFQQGARARSEADDAIGRRRISPEAGRDGITEVGARSLPVHSLRKHVAQSLL
jgi:hypothetical protein